MSLRERKRALRDAVIARRDAQDATRRTAASDAIAARIVALPHYRSAGVVMLTLPFRSEWDARLVAARALAEGRTVAIPRVDAVARMLRPFRIRNLERDIEAGYRGIPEPVGTCETVAVDAIEWVLVPGVAFDRRGCRLGYGGGYYDRLLPLLTRVTTRVAGAFDLQMVDDVPAAPHDIAVDVVVTETRVVDAGSDAA
ncbi:MAG: 5-formyltetrahydrofolate cyclo-ligase [Betaproteobacteria bacterium]